MEFSNKALEDEPRSSDLRYFNIEKGLIRASAYGFSTSSVSLSKLAVMSSGLSGYYEYDMNSVYSMTAGKSLHTGRFKLGGGTPLLLVVVPCVSVEDIAIE
jgi:hypothetical protein